MNPRQRTLSLFCAFATLVWLCNSPAASAQKIAVLTYHNDNFRTGWNRGETKLTPANVASSSFRALKSITLDDQVDAQPLVVPNQLITAGPHQGMHDVVYVATEGNTVYAVDTNNGSILLSPNFGTPVSYPLGCGNNGPNVGINSTPVIDRVGKTMYVVIYTNESNGPVYRIHALDLGSLTDKEPPVVVTGSHTLTDGTTFNFNATYQRQRPALLVANGNVYAGFGSFCDFAANLSRGWLLGWQLNSLTPLASNQVFDTLASSPDDFFLSSIWMSGYGISADQTGNLYFVTGNSDYSGNTYNGVSNIQESVIKVSGDLTQVLDLFTPSDESSLDQSDEDFGSGGALLLPPQRGSTPNLVVAAGKEGNMFLMNRDDLGGFSVTNNNVLGTFYIGGCWCGQSFFVDPSDLDARVVSSGGNTVSIWKVQTSPSVTLINTANSTTFNSGQDPGFFTSISSNKQANPIVWALSRPFGSPYSIYLYAFDPEAGLKQLFSGPAGTWPNTGGNANLVPVVANGKVFVASYRQLTAFGLK
ncbi:MAG: hypothetical protein ACLPOO_01750 [Terriglobales bacterium]